VVLLRNKHQHQKKFAPKFDHAKEWTRVNCKLTTVWHWNSELDYCAVWVSYRKVQWHCKNWISWSE